MWTKKNGHAPKIECAEFFLNTLKNGIYEKNIKFDHSLVFHFLLKVSKMWLANLLTTIFTEEKNE